MSLSEAIDVLKKHKEEMEASVVLRNGNYEVQSYIEAINVVLSWVDKMYAALMRIGS